MTRKTKAFQKKTCNKRRNRYWRGAKAWPLVGYHEMRIRGMSHNEAKKAVSRSCIII